MAKCAACESIVEGKRHAPGHDKLKEISTRKVRPIGQAVIILTEYECTKCGTKWRYEDDRNDPGAGWTSK